ncbi:putative L-aspartate oxidase, chloroplastic-like [Capsicum annuum]|nr:putative L-aspartate oxidase, chloroplastic-like [Capsicum annuum]
MLFKCSWFDLMPKHGTKVHSWYNLVDVNKRRLFNKYEPFIMVMQASQVHFEMYPTVKKTVSEWLAVCPIKARSFIDVSQKVEQSHTLNNPPFQENDSQIHEIDIDKNKILNRLNDSDGMLIDMEEGDEKKEKEKDEDEDKDEDDDDHHDDEEGEGEECEFHKKEKKKNLIFPIVKMEVVIATSLLGSSDDSSEDQELDINRMYFDVAGRAKKWCVYGLGSQASTLYKDQNSVNSANLVSDIVKECIKILEKEVSQMRENQERVL